MAKTRFFQNSFTSGVLSPLIKGRNDIQQYYNGLEVGRNVVVLPQGGIKRRPGTKYIETALPVMTRNTTLPTMPNGGTPANINDDDDATGTVTTVNMGVTDPYVVAEYDYGAATYIEYFDVRGISLSVNSTSDDFVIQYSDNGSTWTTISVLPLVGTADQNFRRRVQREARYFRLAKIGSDPLTVNRVNIDEFAGYEKSSTLSEVKLKDFSVSSSKHYLLQFTDGNCRISRTSDDSFVADIKVPYASADVGDIRDVQTESVILLFHEDYEPIRIINLGADTEWFQDTVPFINTPQFDYDDSLSPTPVDEVQVMTFTGFVAGDTFQIDVEGVLSKNITFAGDGTADEQSATAENIRKNLQDMPVFGTTGIAVARTGALAYTITISGESTKDFELFSGFLTSGTASKTISFTKSASGSPRKEDVWSSTRGWPKTACYYEGRLIIGGTKSKPQSVFASKSGEVFNFELDESDDNDAIFATISSRELAEITDVFPGRNLQIFTAGSEFATRVSPLTPQTFSVVPQTSHGTLYLEAKEIDGATIIADRNGKSVREFVYNFNEDAYITNDISVLSPELIKTPVDIAILGGTTSEDANWVFIVNADGSATVLNTLRAQDINAFTEWTTSGAIQDASVVDDQLYMVNKRTVGGVESYFIEKWSFDYTTDCGIINDYGGVPQTIITGLDHLEGETVQVVGDGSYQGEFTVSSGRITLSNGKSLVQVGLKYEPQIKPMPLSTNVGSGSNQMRLKKILRMNFRVLNTTGLYIDGNPTPVRSFDEAGPGSPLDTPPEQRTGIIEDVYDIGGWSRETMPTITQPDAMPFTILAIEYEVESS